jgi:hypothetical protein
VTGSPRAMKISPQGYEAGTVFVILKNLKNQNQKKINIGFIRRSTNIYGHIKEEILKLQLLGIFNT